MVHLRPPHSSLPPLCHCWELTINYSQRYYCLLTGLRSPKLSLKFYHPLLSPRTLPRQYHVWARSSGPTQCSGPLGLGNCWEAVASPLGKFPNFLDFNTRLPPSSTSPRKFLIMIFDSKVLPPLLRLPSEASHLIFWASLGFVARD